MSPRVGQTRRRDLNEPDIVDALKAFGRRVIRHSGRGEPDLFVQRKDGLWVAMEVKRDAKAGFTPAQADAMTNGHPPVPVVLNSEDAFRALGMIR